MVKEVTKEVKTEKSAPSVKNSVSIKAKKARREMQKFLNDRHWHLSAILITFVVILLAIFFGIQLIFKIGVAHQPGQLILADGLTELDRDFISENLGNIEELTLDHDVTVSSTDSTKLIHDEDFLMKCPDCNTSTYRVILYDVLLPVTDFYDSKSSISVEAAKDGDLVSIWNLQPNQKLLALEETLQNASYYYLDNFNSGAFFQYYIVQGENETDVAKIHDLLQSKIASFPSKDTVLTLAQTGVTALSRRMNSKLAQVGNATYFSEQIAPFLQQFDFVHTSNEASFSKQASGSNICAAPGMIDTLTSIGLNIVELTGNHNQDCGDEDAITTINQYHELNIQTFGGGISAAEAAIPLELTDKDSHITMLGYNLSTGGYTLDDTPGANFYTEEKAQADISVAKERGDFVIVDVQYYECNEYVDKQENTICDAADSSAGDQIGLFRSLIDMGADVVVGTAAHQPQTFELYHDGAIYYGLGNLFFDQSEWPGTTRSLVLVHYFWQNQLLQTRIIPTQYDKNFQTSLMSSEAASQFIERLVKVRPGV